MPETHAAGRDAHDAPDDDASDPALRDPLARAWFEEHQGELRRWVTGQHFLYWSLGIGFVLGLAAHVGGYVLRTSTTGEPLALVADLLYALGFAMWTGVVLVLFTQVIPEAKRRQVARALDALAASRRAGGGADRADPPSGRG